MGPYENRIWRPRHHPHLQSKMSRPSALIRSRSALRCARGILAH